MICDDGMSGDDVFTGEPESVREGGLLMGEDGGDVHHALSCHTFSQPLSLPSRKVFTARRAAWYL